MKHSEKITSVTGALTAVATLACCIPMGFAAAAASASLGAVVASYREWFLGASVALLMIGAVQQRRSCSTRGYGSAVILALSAAVVALVIFFPQVVAGLLADWMP